MCADELLACAITIAGLDETGSDELDVALDMVGAERKSTASFVVDRHALSRDETPTLQPHIRSRSQARITGR